MSVLAGVGPAAVFESSGFGVLTVAIATVIVGVVTALISNRRATIERRQAKQEIARPLDAKLDRILALSRELSSLNTEVQSEFALQLAATEKAQREAKEAESIAALNAEQRQAAEAMVASQIDSALARSGRKDRRFQIGVAVVSFLLGIVVTAAFQFVSAGSTQDAPDDTKTPTSMRAFEQTVDIPLNVVDDGA